MRGPISTVVCAGLIVATARPAAADATSFAEFVAGVVHPTHDRFGERRFRRSPVIGARGGLLFRRPDRSTWAALDLATDWTALSELDPATTPGDLYDDYYHGDFDRGRVLVGGRVGIAVDPTWRAFVRVAVGIDYTRAESALGFVSNDVVPAAQASGGVLGDIGGISLGAELGFSAGLGHEYEPTPSFTYLYESYWVEMLIAAQGRL